MSDKKKLLIFVIGNILLSILIPILLFTFNLWPQGNDVWGHLFKAEFLLDEIRKGNLFPIISPYWYNTIELFRYWPPFTYYIIALISLIFNIDTIYSSAVFLGVCICISLNSFLLIGKRENKLLPSFLIGIAYIFMPHNIEVMIFEGNIPRIFISSLLPLVFFFLTEIIQYKKKYAYGCLMLCFVVITYSHIMISAMLGISIFLYALAYSINTKEWKRPTLAIIAAVLSYFLTIPILLPGLSGGLMSQESLSSVETINQWSQNGFLSLNPLSTQDGNVFYYGFFFFVICLLGIFTYRKDTLYGFVITTLIFLGTTESFLPIVKLMPFSQVFWMRRFVPMAYAIGLLTMLQWKRLKPYLIYVFAFLLIFDGCLRFIPYSKNNDMPQELYEDAESEELLVNKGIELTNNRFAFLDLSSTSSYQSYEIYDSKTKFAFGWSYQGAVTMADIMSINEAFESNFYGYTFSRLSILGCDTISIKKSLFPSADWEEVKKFATLCNYELIEETDKAMLFDLKDVDYEYGTKTTYKNLAIGNSAYYISYIYPTFTSGNSNYIDEYTFEELTQYEKIYLSGFDYHNKEDAENLLKKIANESNTKIFIDADSFKLDKQTGQREFLNIYVQNIEFTDSFPIITVHGKPEFLLHMSTKDYSTWKTSYLINVPNETGSSKYGDKALAYLGTDETGNITYIGYNLVYYCVVGNNESLDFWLDYTFDENIYEIPTTTFYPIETQYDNDTITITTYEDNVNTNVAWVDSFDKYDVAIKDGNLLQLPKGTHTFVIKWPYLTISSLITLFGLAICTIFIIYIYKKED